MGYTDNISFDEPKIPSQTGFLNELRFDDEPVDFAKEGQIKKPVAASGLDSVNLFPAGYGADPLGQSLQNQAQAPRMPQPTQIVQAEQQSPDLVTAFNAPVQDRGAATLGYMAEAPNVQSNAELDNAIAAGENTEVGKSIARMGLNVARVTPAIVQGAYDIGHTIGRGAFVDNYYDDSGTPAELNQKAQEALKNDPVHGGLQLTNDAIKWAATGTDPETKQYIGGSPFALTPEQRQAHPTLTNIADVVEGLPAFGAELALSGGRNIPLGILSGLSHYSESRGDTSALPGSIVQGGLFAGMGAVANPIKAGLARIPIVGTLSKAANQALVDTAYMTSQSAVVGATDKGTGINPDFKIEDVVGAKNLLTTAGQAAIFAIAHAFTPKPNLKRSNLYEVPAEMPDYEKMFESYKAAKGEHPTILEEKNALFDEMIRGVRAAAGNTAPSVGQVHDAILALRKATADRVLNEKGPVVNEGQQITQDTQPKTTSQTPSTEAGNIPEANTPATTLDPNVTTAIEKVRAAIAARQKITADELPPIPVANKKVQLPDYNELMRKKANLETSMFRPNGAVQPTATLKMADNYAVVTQQIAQIQAMPDFQSRLKSPGDIASLMNIPKGEVKPNDQVQEVRGRGQEEVTTEGAGSPAPLKVSDLVSETTKRPEFDTANPHGWLRVDEMVKNTGDRIDSFDPEKHSLSNLNEDLNNARGGLNSGLSLTNHSEIIKDIENKFGNIAQEKLKNVSDEALIKYALDKTAKYKSRGSESIGLDRNGNFSDGHGVDYITTEAHRRGLVDKNEKVISTEPTQSSKPELVKVRTNRSTQVYVKQSHLDNPAKTLLPMFDKNGARVEGNNSVIHRDNLDLTGNAPDAYTKDMDVVFGKNDAPFKTKAATTAQITKMKIGETHEPLEIPGGFAIVKKGFTFDGKKLIPPSGAPKPKAGEVDVASPSPAELTKTADFNEIPRWEKPVTEIKEGDEARLTASEAQLLADKSGDGYIYRVTSAKYFDSGKDSGNPEYGQGFQGVKDPIKGITSFGMNDTDRLVSIKVNNEIPEEKGKMVLYRIRPDDIGGELVVIKRGGDIIHLYSDTPIDTSKAEVVKRDNELVSHYDALRKKEEGTRHEIQLEDSELDSILAELNSGETGYPTETDIPEVGNGEVQPTVEASTEASTDPNRQLPGEDGEERDSSTVDTETPPTEPVTVQAEDKPDGKAIPAETPEEKLFKIAKEAHAHTAMNPTTTGKVWRDGMVSAAKDLHDELSKIAQTNDQKDVLITQIERYKSGYLEHSIPILRAISSQVSVMVAGGSKFKQNHGKRNERLQSAEQKAIVDFNKWNFEAKNNAKAAILRARSAEQVTADEKLIADAAEKKANGKAEAERYLVKKWMNLKVGDQLDIGNKNGNPIITKKNRKSVETGSGAKWTFSELHSIPDKRVNELLAELEKEAADAKTPVTTKNETLAAITKKTPVTEATAVNKPIEPILPVSSEAKTFTLPDTYDFDTHKEIQSRIIDGKITPAELKDAFEAFALNKDTIKAKLLKRYDAKTLKKMERGFYPGKTKGESASNIVNQIESDFVLGSGVSYSPFTGEKYIDAVRKLVDKYTEEDIAKYAEKMAEIRKERSDRIAKAKEALVNPQSLEDYRYLMQVNKAKGTEPLLTPEQQIKYDELVALDNKEKGIVTQERKAVVQAAGAPVDSEIVETTHTRDNYPLFVVKAAERVDAETYKAWNATAKKLGGWYSKYAKDGAIPGFQFKTKENAEAFQAYVKGDSVTATETIKSVMEDRAEEKKAGRADKLRTTAEKVKADAEAELNKDRLANTAKRASQASSAEAAANSNIALAKTMINLADAIDSGEAVHLDGVWAKAHVETLNSLVRNSKHNYERNNKISYTDSQKRIAGMEDIEAAEYPYPHAHKSHLRDIVTYLRGKQGGKRLAEWLDKKIMASGDESIVDFRTSDDIDKLTDAISKASSPAAGRTVNYAAENSADRMKDYKRLQVMKIKDRPSLRAALREFLQFKEAKKEGDKAKALERALVGQKVGIDFFPTPAATAQQMVEMAGVKPGMKVLEPSAGNGNIAEQLRAAGGDVDTVEVSSSLRDILEAKGFNNVDHDFMDYNPGPIYDAIVMNPPFGNGADMDHIQHAYAMLKPGGKLIAIAGEGAFFRGGSKETAFRDWLDENNASVEKLPEGTFSDRKLMNTTNTNARLIEIEKSGETITADVSSVQAVTPPETVAEETLLQYQLLREFGGKWQYKTKLGSTWLTANRKEDAVERASHTYGTTPKEELLTPEEKGKIADDELIKRLDARYGKMSIPELENEYERLGGEISDYQKSGTKEFNGNGGRRTSAAVSNEGARGAGQDKLELGIYLKYRKGQESEGRTTSSPGTVDRREIEQNRMKLSSDASKLRDELRNLESRYRRSSKSKSKDEIMDMIKAVTSELRPKEAKLKELDAEYRKTMLEDSAEQFKDSPIELKATQLMLSGPHGKTEAEDYLRTESEKIAKGLLGDSDLVEIKPTTFDMAVNSTTRSIEMGGVVGPGQVRNSFEQQIEDSLKYKVIEAIKALGASNGMSAEYGQRANDIWDDKQPKYAFKALTELHKDIIKEQEQSQAEFEASVKEIYDAPQQDYVIATLRPTLTKDDIKSPADVVQAFKDGTLAYERGKRDTTNYADVENKEALDQKLQEMILDKDAKFTVGKDKITITVKAEPMNEAQKGANIEKQKELITKGKMYDEMADRLEKEGLSEDEITMENGETMPENQIKSKLETKVWQLRGNASSAREDAAKLNDAKNTDTKYVFWFNAENPMERAGNAGGEYLYGLIKPQEALTNARRAMKDLAKIDKVFANNPMLTVTVKEHDDGSKELRLVWSNGRTQFSLLPSAFGLQQDTKRLLLQSANGQNEAKPVMLKAGDTVKFSPGYLENKTDEVFLVPNSKMDGKVFYNTASAMEVVHALSPTDRNAERGSDQSQSIGGMGTEEPAIVAGSEEYKRIPQDVRDKSVVAFSAKVPESELNNIVLADGDDHINTVASTFGKRIVMYTLPKGYTDSGGFWHTAEPHSIYINTKSQTPYFVVLGHELIHALKKQFPKLYKELERLNISKEAFNHTKAESDKVYERDVNKDDVNEEVYANFNGANFSRASFWDRLAKQSPAVFEKLISMAKALVQRVLQALRGGKYKTDHYFDDLKKADRIFTNVMARYADMAGNGAKERLDTEIKRAATSIFSKLKETRGSLGEMFGREIKKIENDFTPEQWEHIAKEAGTTVEDVKQILGYSEPVKLDSVPVKPIKFTNPIADLFGNAPSGSEFTTSTKNAVTEEDRATRGLDPVEQHMKFTDPVMYREGQRLIQSQEYDPRIQAINLAKNPRPISAAEQMALLIDRVSLRNESNTVMEMIVKASEAGDAERVLELRQRMASLEDAFNDNEVAARRVGTEWSASGRARQLLMAEDYSYIRTINRARMEMGKNKLPEAIRVKLEELTAQLEAATAKHAEYEEKIAALEAQKWVRREQNKATASPTRTQKRSEAKAVASTRIKELKSVWGDMMSGYMHSMSITTEQAKVLIEMAKEHIVLGLHNADEIVSEIYDEIKGMSPDALEPRDIRDAISGYGKTFKMSQDEIAKELRELKAQMRLVSAYEDASSGEMPLRTGLQRDPMSDETRELQKKVKQAMRESGIANVDGRSPEEQWKSSLDAVKTRLKNQIHDLNQQIETGEKTPKKIGITYDEEAQALKAEVERLKAALVEIEGKPEMSPEQRIQMAMSAVEKSIAEYERRISEQDLNPKKPESKTPITPELQALRDKRDALKADYKAMQDEAKPKLSNEERYLKIFKTRQAKRMQDLQTMLDTGNFEKAPKKSYRLDPEAQALKAEVGKIKNQIDIEIRKIQLANRSRLEKGLDWAYKIRRAILLSGVGTLEKLTAAATTRSFVTNPIEEAIGSIIRMIPLLSDIDAQAPREGGGMSARAEAAAFKTWFMKETWKDTWQVLKTGKGELDHLYGHHHNDFPPEWIEFFGRVHGALKNPAKRAEFARALQKRSEWAIRNNMDLTEPDVMAAVTTGAYIDGLRTILMDDNAVVQMFRVMLRLLESKGDAGKTIATGIQLGLPIVKIPTNFAAEVGLHIGGIPYAAYKTHENMKEQKKTFREALKNLPPDEADIVIRAIKKNIFGMILLALGASLAEYVGGFYQKGEKRKFTDPKAQEIRVGNIKVGRHLQHNAAMETVQAGATAIHVRDSYKNATKKGKDETGRKVKDIYHGEGKPGAEVASFMAIAMGVLKTIPFIDTPYRAIEALQGSPEARGKWAAQQVESMVTPPDVRNIAKSRDTYGDVLVPRDNKTFSNVMKSSIPGLREDVPLNVAKLKYMDPTELYVLTKEAPEKISREIMKNLSPKKRAEVNRAGLSANQ